MRTKALIAACLLRALSPAPADSQQAPTAIESDPNGPRPAQYAAYVAGTYTLTRKSRGRLVPAQHAHLYERRPAHRIT